MASLTTPQLYDRFMQKTAIAFFILALNYVIDIVQYYAAEDVSKILGYLGLGGAAVIVILLFPDMVRLMRLRRQNTVSCREPEGFVVENFKKAAAKGFMITFLFLTFLKIVTKNLLADLPAAVVVNITLALLLGTVSIAFYIFNRDDGEDEGEFNESDEV